MKKDTVEINCPVKFYGPVEIDGELTLGPKAVVDVSEIVTKLTIDPKAE